MNNYLLSECNGHSINSKKTIRKYLFTTLFILSSIMSLSAANVVTGTVTDVNVSPLVGVSVMIEGTSQGTITNIDGKYSIEVASEDATLTFSYIGYVTQKIKVGNQTVINVTLAEDVKHIDEVVVVGYGTQKKSVVTGAIASVRAKDMEDMVIPRVEDALKGRTAGVTVANSSGAPGTSSSVMVRGITSINNREPLYVVDGVAMPDGGLDQINKSDIQSIEVLKDAASAAIYGTAAAAGVILITTKKGAEGDMKVSLNSTFGVQSPERKLSLTNATQYAYLRNETSIADGGSAIFADPESLGEGTDWQAQIFNYSAPIQNHELSLTGGGQKSTYFASVGYFDQTGIIASDISSFRRMSLRLNTDHKVKKWLTVGNSITYTNTKSKTNVSENDYYGNVLNSAISLDPLTPVTYSDKNKTMPSEYAVKDDNGYYYGISQYVGQEMINPLAFIQVNKNNSYNYSDNFNGNFYVQIEPIANLKFRSQFGGRMSFYGYENFNSLHFYSTTQSNTGSSSYTRDNEKSWNLTFSNTLSYDKKINDHSFSAMVGTELRENSGSGMAIVYYNTPASNLKESSLNYVVVDSAKTSWGYDNQLHKLISYFGRLNYNYMDKYIATAIIRRDGSSNFGKNNKYGNFPSASFRWNVNNESFWKENEICDALDFRLGYGVNGFEDFTPYSYTSTMKNVGGIAAGNDRNVLLGTSPSAPANPDLRWERTTQINLGIDATLFKNLNAAFDIYRKNTSDMLMYKQIPGYVGANGDPWSNVASLYNQGVELNLTYIKNLNKNFNITVIGNIAYNQSKITYLADNNYVTLASMQASNYEVERMMIGKPYGMFWGFKTNGIFQTQEEIDNYVNKDGKKLQPNAKPGDFKWVDINKDGQITSYDRENLGLAIAPVTFGITFKVAYQNWDATIFGQGVTGNKICNQIRRLDVPTSNYLTTALGRWTGPGTSSTYPRLTNTDTNGNFTNMSDFYLEDGTYFRLKTLQIGYSLPTELIKKISLEKVRVYASSTNLFTLTKYTGYDPEIGGDQGIYGIDRGVYPQARSFMLGLDLKF